MTFTSLLKLLLGNPQQYALTVYTRTPPHSMLGCGHCMHYLKVKPVSPLPRDYTPSVLRPPPCPLHPGLGSTRNPIAHGCVHRVFHLSGPLVRLSRALTPEDLTACLSYSGLGLGGRYPTAHGCTHGGHSLVRLLSSCPIHSGRGDTRWPTQPLLPGPLHTG